MLGGELILGGLPVPRSPHPFDEHTLVHKCVICYSFHAKVFCCILNCFMLSSLPCFYRFADLLSRHLVIFNVFMSLFFSSRCMLELKFAIYYRAASLPSQASHAVHNSTLIYL